MEPGELVKEARAALALDPEPFASAQRSVPSSPGLYAVHAAADIWESLGLGGPPDGRPLYVGKAEDSLADRILDTHLYDGRTGFSTVRRSFAALLRDRLGLRGMPRRTPAKPRDFQNYGLPREHDRLLTDWMKRNLKITCWKKPDGCPLPLKEIERNVLDELRPPLNLQDVETPWRTKVKAARKMMAEDARSWQASP